MRKMNSTDLNHWIGGQIYRERIARKISQEALAEAADVSRVFISNLENGNCGAKIDITVSPALLEFRSANFFAEVGLPEQRRISFFC